MRPKNNLLIKMEVKVTFTYSNRAFKITCKEDDEMDKMFQQFIDKLNDGSEKEHYIYYYDNKKLGHESTIKKNKYLSQKNEINISVQKKLRIIKCPKCINDSIINLNNYIASFYGCKHDHSDNEVYDQYIYLQNIDNNEIRCSEPNCDGQTQQDYTKGFYKCLNCSKLIKDRSIYFCKDHFEQHDKEHLCVKYDKKNYYCVNHFRKFIKYCFTHKENLCEECEKVHGSCKIAKYKSMTPDIDKLKESLKTMEKNIRNLQIVINDLKYRLDGAMRIFKRYHYIAKDIVGKFELFNQDLKNHRILRSLWNLQTSNKKMNDELTQIIQEEDILQKIKLTTNIYEKNKENRENKNKILVGLNENKNEFDDWWEEIQEFLKQSKRKTKNEKEEENGNGNNKIGGKNLKKNITPGQKK